MGSFEFGHSNVFSLVSYHMWSSDGVPTNSSIRHNSTIAEHRLCIVLRNWWDHYSCRPHHFLCVQQKKHQNSIRQHNPELKAFKFQFNSGRCGAVTVSSLDWSLMCDSYFVSTHSTNQYKVLHRYHCSSAPTVRRSCSHKFNNVAEMRDANVCVCKGAAILGQTTFQLWQKESVGNTPCFERIIYEISCVLRITCAVCVRVYYVCGENRFRFEMFSTLLTSLGCRLTNWLGLTAESIA